MLNMLFNMSHENSTNGSILSNKLPLVKQQRCFDKSQQCLTFVHQQMSNRVSFALRNKLCCMLVWIVYTWGSFLKSFQRIYWSPHLFRILVGAEDMVYVTIENHPTSLLFLLLSSFFCPFVHYTVLRQQCLLHKVHLRYRILIVEFSVTKQ